MSTPADTRSRLDAEGLQKRYGARLVVQDVHLAVHSGEVVGLLGPNGAGKTTSFYMLVGLVRADAGQIRIDGRRVERLPIHQRARLGLSYLPQEASIFRRLTVEENIRAVLELQLDADGRPLSRARIDALLDKNPHVKFANGARRGYAKFEVTPQRWETSFRAVADAADAQSRVFDLAQYVVEDRRPGPQRG